MAKGNPNPKPPPVHSRFKPGQVANPLGANAHNPLLKALRKLTVKTFQEVVELTLTSNLEGLQKIAKDPKSTSLQVGVATSMLRAIKNGDYSVIERIAERIIGKLPDRVIVDSLGQVNLKIEKDQIKEAVKALEDDV